MKKGLAINLLFFLIVLSLCIVAAELLFRSLDHQSLNGSLKYLYGQLDPKINEKVEWISIQLIKEHGLNIDTSLFYSLPETPLKTPGRFKTEINDVRKHSKWFNIVECELRVWNSNFIKKLYCDNAEGFNPLEVSQGLEVIYTFESYDNSSHPVYRFFPDSRSANEFGKVSFNNFGWSGNKVTLTKPNNTIRIAFLGASTTQQTSFCDFAYADFIGNWLNMWATKSNMDIHFEVINTGRVGLKSPDFAAIMKYELAPLEPDVVIYYEGRNQFVLDNMVCNCVESIPVYSLLKRSALFRRTVSGLDLDIFKKIEKSKPADLVKIPLHVNIKDPDLDSPSLPLDLPYILRDLDSIRVMNERLNSTFIVCSYAMLVNETVLSGGLKYGSVYSWWMEQYGPIKLKEIEMLNELENIVFKKYCERHNLKYIDVAKELPRLPEAFMDGVHLNCEGMKYHAWIVFSDLLPYIEEKISRGSLPHQSKFTFSHHPYINENFKRVELPFSCN